MIGEKFHLKKQIITVLLGLSLWGIVAWLFIDAPLIVVNTMPQLLPLAVFAFLLFLTGLLLLTGVLLSCVRSRGRRFSWLVILLVSSMVVLYNLSPLRLPGHVSEKDSMWLQSMQRVKTARKNVRIGMLNHVPDGPPVMANRSLVTHRVWIKMAAVARAVVFPIYPIPTPAPAKPAAANPMPNNAAAAESIVCYSSLV